MFDQFRPLSEADAAAWLGVEPGTLRKWRQKRIGPAWVESRADRGHGKRVVWYQLAHLEQFVQLHKRQTKRLSVLGHTERKKIRVRVLTYQPRF